MHIDENLSMRAISRKTGFNDITIKKWMERAGIEIVKYRSRAPSVPRRTSDEDLRRMYETEGLSCEQIGERVGESTGTIAHWLNEIGVQMRPTGGLPSQSGRPGVWRTVISREERPYDRDREGNILTVTMDVLECGHKVQNKDSLNLMRATQRYAAHPRAATKERHCARCEKENQ